MGRFLGATPTPVDNFRGIVLFGRNVASYKFALAQALIDLASLQYRQVPEARRYRRDHAPCLRG